MESQINGRVCFASIPTLSLIWLDRGTASWRTPTVAANNTPLLTSRLILENSKKNLGGIASSNMFAKHARALSDPLLLRYCLTVACLK